MIRRGYRGHLGPGNRLKLSRSQLLLCLACALVFASAPSACAQTPNARLEALVRQTGAKPLADTPGVSAKKLDGIDKVAVFRILPMSPEDGSDSEFLVVSQEDPGLTAPFAAVGDKLPILYRAYEGPSGNGSATVRARIPYKAIPEDQVYCEREFVKDGWAYLLEYDSQTAATLLTLPSHSSYVVTAEFATAARQPLSKAAFSALTDVITTDRKNAFDAVMKEWGTEYEQQARTWILREPYEGEEVDPEVDPFEYIKAQAESFRGPQGLLYLHAESMSDDLSDKGQDTRYTYVLDANGQLVTKVEGMHEAVGVADFNGDGIDEIVTADGLIRWTGTKWMFPPGGEVEYCD